jgi:tetratricopeptide (TPR) repeat protein
MRVFLSHSSADKPLVETLARGLAQRGIDPWFDIWEMGPGDNLVARINEGLATADAGIIVLSEQSSGSRWVEAELSNLIYNRIEEGQLLLPVKVADGSPVPELIKPLLWISIEDIDGIAAALLRRGRGKPPVIPSEQGKAHQVLVNLSPAAQHQVAVSVAIDDTTVADTTILLPQRLRGPCWLPDPAGDPGGLMLGALGQALWELCFPAAAAGAFVELLEGAGSQVGKRVEVAVATADSRLLALPFEALQLPDGRPLVLLDTVTLQRRLNGPSIQWQPLAGPLKVLVAVAAPDRGGAEAVLLDYEREVSLILEALQPLRRMADPLAQVRLLEVGHPDQIRQALQRDGYHVLHLSCHGRPGELQLETEDGEALPCSAADLLAALRQAGRPLPLVVLNACHGASRADAPASLAEALLRGGVPAVLAMQTAISDRQAIALAHSFYGHLAARELFLASQALAQARLEWQRRQRALDGPKAPAGYANAALLVAGSEQRLADFGLDQQPLKVAPVHQLDGQGVPQLAMDELIGRRSLMRETLRRLRCAGNGRVGVVLTGIGGVGKSAMAGRLMWRLKEDGHILIVQVGRWNLTELAALIGEQLRGCADPALSGLGARLQEPISSEAVLFQRLRQALAELPMLVVLDDFEQNLTSPGGAAFIDGAVAEQLIRLCEAMQGQQSKLLITSRHPLPEAALTALLAEQPLPPLSEGETGKLLLRLPAIERLSPAEQLTVRRVIGGHPRMLELLDALLRHGQGRSPAVSRRLAALQGSSPQAPGASPLEAIDAALVLGARDVLLDELLALAREQGTEAVLLQLAVSNLPVSPRGLAWMLADGAESGPAMQTVEAALNQLAALSLLYRSASDGSVWVHRWNAEGLAQRQERPALAERYGRAGRYRIWRIQNESLSSGEAMGDVIEAVRNFLAGEDFDAASSMALGVLQLLVQAQQSVAVAALGSEVLETLPIEHPNYAPIADQEARAFIALGQSARAFERYGTMLREQERKAKAEPDRADYQRDLSVSYNKMGDLYGALGQGEQARDAYAKALAIRERLAKAEPDRADYQRDLSVSYNRMGDLYRALGQGEQARDAYAKALAIAERLAKAEPDRADYQVDLVISLVRIGMSEPPSQELLIQALNILQQLEQEGRLAPEHSAKIGALQEIIDGFQYREVENGGQG